MAEKTVKQLEAEYAKITEENRKAYDEFVGVWGGPKVKGRYEDALAKLSKAKTAEEKAKYQAIIDEVKPRYDKLSAAYAATQEKKNALKKELEAAKKAESESKTSAAKQKSAKSAYDEAKKNYDKAAAAYDAGGYKAEENYIAAYKTLQTATGEYTKAGGKAPELPTPKVTIPTAEGDTGKQGDTGGESTGITSYSDALKYLTDPTNKEALIQAQKFLSKFGYKGNIKGDPDLSFTYALEKAAKEYANLPEAWRPASLLDYLANPLSSGAAGTGVVGGGGPQVTLYPDITNEQDGKITINKYFQDKFGRDATPEEFKAAYAEVKKQQENKPRKQTVTTNAKGQKVVSYTGGTSTDQILNDFVAGKPKLVEEATAFEASDAKAIQRNKDRKAYEKLVAAAGGNAAKIAALANTTAYGKDLAYVRRQIESRAITAGADLSAAEIDALAKEAVDGAIDTNIYELNSFIDSKLKFGASKDGVYKGAAGESVDALTKIAAANGLDLQKAFGAQLPDWLTAINKGESIETYKKIIRDVAKIGMPEKVAKLIDQGIDLSTIYAPYKNIMASTLEINPQTIDMNDPTLRSAITADTEVPIYEFERQLRKDNRWQYTNQAKQEVASATQKILQDFGFMG